MLCFVYTQRYIIEKVCRQITLSSKLHDLLLFRPGLQLLCFFFSIASSSSSLNWLLIISLAGLSVVSGGFPSRFLKCSFHIRSLFLGWRFWALFAGYFFFPSFYLLSSMLIMIICLLLNFWFYWIGLGCILAILFAMFKLDFSRLSLISVN